MTSPEPTVLVEPDILDEPEPEVIELMTLQEVTPRLMEVEESYSGCCRSARGVYHGAIAIFASYESFIVSEIT